MNKRKNEQGYILRLDGHRFFIYRIKYDNTVVCIRDNIAWRLGCFRSVSNVPCVDNRFWYSVCVKACILSAVYSSILYVFADVAGDLQVVGVEVQK
jgi:hypothetical protein